MNTFLAWAICAILAPKLLCWHKFGINVFNARYPVILSPSLYRCVVTFRKQMWLMLADMLLLEYILRWSKSKCKQNGEHCFVRVGRLQVQSQIGTFALVVASSGETHGSTHYPSHLILWYSEAMFWVIILKSNSIWVQIDYFGMSTSWDTLSAPQSTLENGTFMHYRMT